MVMDNHARGGRCSVSCDGGIGHRYFSDAGGSSNDAKKKLRKYSNRSLQW